MNQGTRCSRDAASTILPSSQSTRCVGCILMVDGWPWQWQWAAWCCGVPLPSHHNPVAKTKDAVSLDDQHSSPCRQPPSTQHPRPAHWRRQRGEYLESAVRGGRGEGGEPHCLGGHGPRSCPYFQPDYHIDSSRTRQPGKHRRHDAFVSRFFLATPYIRQDGVVVMMMLAARAKKKVAEGGRAGGRPSDHQTWENWEQQQRQQQRRRLLAAYTRKPPRCTRPLNTSSSTRHGIRSMARCRAQNHESRTRLHQKWHVCTAGTRWRMHQAICGLSGAFQVHIAHASRGYASSRAVASSPPSRALLV